MSVEDKAKSLVEYIGTLADFQIIHPYYPYNHMGATITDAVLQAGINYNTVVAPRVRLIFEYPEAKTTSGFLRLVKQVSPQVLLKWKGEKPRRILRICDLFIREKIETEGDLKIWLAQEENVRKLRAVKGVGDKTLDYFKMLSGIHTSAIDRHLRNFLGRAGVYVHDYSKAQKTINSAARQMKIEESVLDHSIWKYMSDKKGARIRCAQRGKSHKSSTL